MSGPSAIQVTIPPISQRARQQARARQDRLTKPAGSLVNEAGRGVIPVRARAASSVEKERP